MAGLLCPIWKKKKSTLILQNSVSILEKSVLFVRNYGLNSHLKCSFKSVLEKKHQIFHSGALLLNVVHETFIKVPLFQETSPVPKLS